MRPYLSVLSRLVWNSGVLQVYYTPLEAHPRLARFPPDRSIGRVFFWVEDTTPPYLRLDSALGR